jgi:prepilin-type N-terminal cleavage/methylation domain-containing protein
MNSANTNPSHRNAAWRRLPVVTNEFASAVQSVRITHFRKDCQRNDCQGNKLEKYFSYSSDNHSSDTSVFALVAARRAAPLRLGGKGKFHRRAQPAFTILELLIVIGIIGFMAALALPHLSGFTKGNSLTAATHQLLDDVAFARQRALVNRSEVCMVFLPPNFWFATTNFYNPSQEITNLSAHQYAAYALIALRSVGDQPGKSNVHYLTDWKYLPQGIYISPFQFTNSQLVTNYIYTTNTTTGSYNSNGWPVLAFPTNIYFPFPSTFNAGSNFLPYIAFTPGGQLASGVDQFISLTAGSIFYPTDTNGLPLFTNAPNLAETPPGNATNNANLIHIDWLTARARLERNQF